MAPVNRYNLLCIIYVTLGAFFYGYDSGCTTSILGYPSFIEYFKFNANTLGALGSVYYAGNAIGSLLMTYLADKFGRLRTIQIASVISLLGAALQTGATGQGMLMGGRVVGGLACGIVYSVCPLYASEISPPEIRGRVGGLYSFNVAFSYFTTEWLGLGFSYINGDAAWRVFLGLQLLCAVLMLGGSFFMPFSPRWLAMKGRNDEALAVLQRMHANAEDPNFYRAEFHQITSQLELEKSEKLGLMSILRVPSYRKRLLICTIFMVGQQGTGIIPLQNYQVLLYEALGIKNKLILILVGVWGSVTVLSTTTGSLLFDRMGRRRAFFIAMSIITVASILIAAFWARFQDSGNTNKTLGDLTIASMFLFLVGYAFIMNSMAYAYIPEILPTRIRAAGVGFSWTIQSCVIVMLVQCTPLGIQNISWKFFMIFIFVDAIYMALAFWLFPETTGKPLEEIGALFGDAVAETLAEAEKRIEADGDRGRDIEDIQEPKSTTALETQQIEKL